jgi:opacity protein-like surface antigen
MRTVITFVIGVLLCTAATAQLNKRPVTFSGGLEVAIPRGEFNDSWGQQMFGLSANLAVPMRRLPFDIGGDFSWARMGRETSTVPVNEDFLEATTGTMEVTSNLHGYHALARLKPFNGKVSPYVEGLIGLRHFSTTTTIAVDGMDQDLLHQRDASNFVFSRGWAVGLQFAPTKIIYIEGRVESLSGGKVTYVDPSTISISPSGDVSYGTQRSGTNVVNVHLGIGFRF